MFNKLNGIAAGANNYSHPSSSGYRHIPSGGSSGQILRWSSDGAAAWGSDYNTWQQNTISQNGYVTAPGSSNGNKVWKTDGAGNPGWRNDANTTYSLSSLGAASASDLNDLRNTVNTLYRNSFKLSKASITIHSVFNAGVSSGYFITSVMDPSVTTGIVVIKLPFGAKKIHFSVKADKNTRYCQYGICNLNAVSTSAPYTIITAGTGRANFGAKNIGTTQAIINYTLGGLANEGFFIGGDDGLTATDIQIIEWF